MVSQHLKYGLRYFQQLQFEAKSNWIVKSFFQKVLNVWSGEKITSILYNLTKKDVLSYTECLLFIFLKLMIIDISNCTFGFWIFY